LVCEGFRADAYADAEFLLAGAVFGSGNVSREGAKAGAGVVGLNLSPEEGHSHGIVWVGAEVDSVNGVERYSGLPGMFRSEDVKNHTLYNQFFVAQW